MNPRILNVRLTNFPWHTTHPKEIHQFRTYLKILAATHFPPAAHSPPPLHQQTTPQPPPAENDPAEPSLEAQQAIWPRTFFTKLHHMPAPRTLTTPLQSTTNFTPRSFFFSLRSSSKPTGAVQIGYKKCGHACPDALNYDSSTMAATQQKKCH